MISDIIVPISLQVTTGFTAQAIKDVCTEVITKERVETATNFKPFTAGEFVEKIAKYDPIYRAEHEDFIKWFHKTPLMKARIARLGIGDDKKGGKHEKGKEKKGKGGKKKKKK